MSPRDDLMYRDNSIYVSNLPQKQLIFENPSKTNTEDFASVTLKEKFFQTASSFGKTK